MRLIHHLPFDAQEIEMYRQLIFNNLTRGMQALLEAMEDMELNVSAEHHEYINMIENAPDIADAEPFPRSFYEPLKNLWVDTNVQKTWIRGNEAALPEK